MTDGNKPEGATAEDKKKDSKGPWWRQIATWLTVIGLLVTLFFNTLAVRNSRESAEINLLTTLNDRAIATEKELNALKLPDPCDKFAQGSLLNTPEETALLVVLDGHEYLAWLFNQERLGKSARDFIGPRMNAGWLLANRFIPADTMRATYPQLSSFYDKTEPGKRGPGPCPTP